MPDEVGDLGTGSPSLAESVVDLDLACVSNRRSGARVELEHLTPRSSGLSAENSARPCPHKPNGGASPHTDEV